MDGLSLPFSSSIDILDMDCYFYLCFAFSGICLGILSVLTCHHAYRVILASAVFAVLPEVEVALGAHPGVSFGPDAMHMGVLQLLYADYRGMPERH